MKLPGNHTDAALVTRLNNGDKDAFALIYRTYVSELYRYARRNISVKEDCEEIVQEIFESLWARRKEIRINTSVHFYLFGMVRYKIIHYIRNGSTRKKYAEHYLLFEAVYEQTDQHDIDLPAIEATLDKLLTELPERCQVALRLRLTEDLSNGDIAKRMNITKRTVEGYMLKAFSHIRSSYQASLKQS